MENARRQIAKECLIELRSHGIPNDKLATQILDKYTPRFKPLNHTKYNTKDVMCQYIRNYKRKRKMETDLIDEKDVFKMIGKKRTAIWRLRRKCGFPDPVLNYPARYKLSAIERWLENGGVNADKSEVRG